MPNLYNMKFKTRKIKCVVYRNAFDPKVKPKNIHQLMSDMEPIKKKLNKPFFRRLIPWPPKEIESKRKREE
jgi:hypothetical protein